jgi:mono/diheme cytochrome c family protein
MPRPVIHVLLVLIALSWIPLALIAKSRATDSTSPRIQVIPDMDNQPKFKTQTANPLFADGRAMRAPVDGAIPAGVASGDETIATGRRGEAFLARSPLPVTAASMRRGQERFGIFCAPCHGLGGAGNGAVSQRADRLAEGTWTPPTDLAGQLVRERPDGEIFNTIKHGIRNMPGYGPQIPVEDSWAIVAYVRALQLSRNATLDDVPSELAPALK